MGAGSSTDKAMGSALRLATQGTKTVAKDQMGKWEDFYQHPFTMLLPSILGAIFIVVAIIIGIISCKPSGSDGNLKCQNPSAIIAGGLLVVGIVTIAVVQFVLAVRHPRATAEAAIFDAVTS